MHRVFPVEQTTRRFGMAEGTRATLAFRRSPGAASIAGAALSADGGRTAH